MFKKEKISLFLPFSSYQLFFPERTTVVIFSYALQEVLCIHDASKEDTILHFALFSSESTSEATLSVHEELPF